jgi:hypothetical protein
VECQKKADALGIPVAAKESGLIVEEQHSGADLRWLGTEFMELVGQLCWTRPYAMG